MYINPPKLAPTATQNKDQKVAAFSEIGLSALCAQRSIKRPKIASRVNIAIDSGSKPMCGVFSILSP